jgi:hypothetical protein
MPRPAFIVVPGNTQVHHPLVFGAPRMWAGMAEERGRFVLVGEIGSMTGTLRPRCLARLPPAL